MKSNKIMWVLVGLLVLTTIAVTFDVSTSRGQEKTAVLPTATPLIDPSFKKYGIADYDAVESLGDGEIERRQRISQRYDKDGWVVKNPHPEDVMVGRFTEEEPPPKIPAAESDLIVVGKVLNVATRLSNDKSGVYSEYTIKIDEILKNNVSIEAERMITIDRAGGYVRYPHGQIILYRDNEMGMPEIGLEYALFLEDDEKSENYKIITLYELQETNTIPLDAKQNFDDITRMGKSGFLRTVREKLSRLGINDARRKP